ncbi:Colanic acid biosysnthesis glycosyl transferase WcaI [Escherichia coli ISC41]|nr:Colanic acid biosysnthesis glycosyl transferase WcaI [Escherichia coli ISC41]
MQFFPLQSYDALPALLKMGDCHLVVQKNAARQMPYCRRN